MRDLRHHNRMVNAAPSSKHPLENCVRADSLVKVATFTNVRSLFSL